MSSYVPVKYACPICASELRLFKNVGRDIEWMKCCNCYLWSNYLSKKGVVPSRMVTRWGFVKIKSAIRDFTGKHKDIVTSITETISIINETRMLWAREEYREHYMKTGYYDKEVTEDKKPLPHFAFYDLLGDWGLIKQQEAFGRILPKLEKQGVAPLVFLCSIAYNTVIEDDNE